MRKRGCCVYERIRVDVSIPARRVRDVYGLGGCEMRAVAQYGTRLWLNIRLFRFLTRRIASEIEAAEALLFGRLPKLLQAAGKITWVCDTQRTKRDSSHGGGSCGWPIAPTVTSATRSPAPGVDIFCTRSPGQFTVPWSLSLVTLGLCIEMTPIYCVNTHTPYTHTPLALFRGGSGTCQVYTHLRDIWRLTTGPAGDPRKCSHFLDSVVRSKYLPVDFGICTGRRRETRSRSCGA